MSTAQAAPKAEEARPPAPVGVSFEKSAGDDGPYVMTVTNNGTDAVKIKVAVLASVQVHNKPKKREFPETTVDAGNAMKVNEVAATDRVTIYVKGYSALMLVAPTGTN